MQELSILDIVLLAVVLLSGLLALLRGFVHEVLSFGAWIGAALVALYAFPYLQPHARELVGVQVVGDVLAGAVVFLIALVVLSMLARSLGRLAQDSSLSALDRTLGLLFGLARGAVLVCLAWLIFAWLVPAAQHPQWVTQARMLPMVREGAELLRSLVPDAFLESLGQTAHRAVQDTVSGVAAESFQQGLQPQPKGVTAAGEPAYNDAERRDLDQVIEGLTGSGGSQ
jgi:membrane protein required for colicin V production